MILAALRTLIIHFTDIDSSLNCNPRIVVILRMFSFVFFHEQFLHPDNSFAKCKDNSESSLLPESRKLELIDHVIRSNPSITVMCGFPELKIRNGSRVSGLVNFVAI